MAGSPRDQFQRCVILAATIIPSLLFLRWAIERPAMGDVKALGASVFVAISFASGTARDTFTPVFQTVTLAIFAITATLAAGLALLLEFRSQPTPATRRLALCLALATYATGWFFFVVPFPAHRELIGFGTNIAWNIALQMAATAAGLLSPWFLLRFFMGYPRAPTDDEWAAHFARLAAEEGDRIRQGWRKHVYGGQKARPLVKESRLSTFRFLRAHGLTTLLAFALVAAIIDGTAAAGGERAHKVLQAFASSTSYMAILLVMVFAFEALRYHVRNAIADDRRRIDWIYGTLLVGGLIVAAVGPLWWASMMVLIPRIEQAGVPIAGPVLFMGPISLAIQLYALAFVVALALSIFSRGTVDPRLALGRVTVFGAVSLVLALLFLVFERAVALQVASWLGISPEYGVLIAGVLVTASFAPVRSRMEKVANAFLLRYLPLDSVVQGERKEQAIVLSDLTGYTALSAKDERQAMLVAALLQRKAQTLMGAHGGRMVKSMGDAVLLAFDDAAAAARVLAALHREFGPAALAVGVEPLEVHSGAHFGDVTQTPDGDVYGQTVNIAARLQGTAQPGQAVVSAAFAAQAALQAPALRPLGAKSLKNVPEPVDCLALELAT